MATEYSTLVTCVNCGIVTRKVRENSTSHDTWLCINCGMRDISTHVAVREASNFYSNPEKTGTMDGGYALDPSDAGKLDDVIDLVTNTGVKLPSQATINSGNAAVISQSFAVTSSVPGSTLTYGASGLPLNLSIASGTGLVTGTTHATTDGTYAVTVTVTDNLTPPNTDAITFNWVVA